MPIGEARPVEVHWARRPADARLLRDRHLDPAKLPARVGESPDQGGADMAERGAGVPVRGGGCEKTVPLVGRQGIPLGAHGIQALTEPVEITSLNAPLDLVPGQRGQCLLPREQGRQGVEQRWSAHRRSVARRRSTRRSGWLGVDAGAPGCPPVDRDLVYGEPLITPANGLRTGCAGTKSTEGEA